MTDIAETRDPRLRRVTIERCGYERFVLGLPQAGAPSFRRPRLRKVDVDDCGVLWRVRLRRDERLSVVQVVDATPRPDGSRKEYFLRVPPSVRTAREAVSWTFGKDPRNYRPAIET